MNSPNFSFADAENVRAAPKWKLIMINGTVIFYNSERGFGYIKPDREKGDGEKKDVRVLQKSLSRAGIKGLTEHQKVKFDTHTDPDSGKLTVNNIEVD